MSQEVYLFRMLCNAEKSIDVLEATMQDIVKEFSDFKPLYHLDAFASVSRKIKTLNGIVYANNYDKKSAEDALKRIKEIIDDYAKIISTDYLNWSMFRNLVSRCNERKK